ncbi:N-acetylglucosaminyldiphosphoundecaprenol N-acetyl-beta-D-mannosaminyltransferase [Paenibacillaceae bacterium GAS479]|nr:N-acetylglucosaminyldiphosphoundecaprenol N-acetyl-beta-D-mannosaminyltransferase [Paenibacillaceae bacterium GAS479]
MRNYSRYKFGKIIDTHITALSFDETVAELEQWVEKKEKQYVCICNTHSLVTASNDGYFQEVLNHAGICTPDGMPLVWGLRAYGYSQQNRVDGPNLMLRMCQLSEQKKYGIFLYGGSEQTLNELKEQLHRLYPSVNIVGAYSPPFRTLTQEEDERVVEMLNQSQADFIFVGLGCPKQEIWMYEHRNRINSVMIGVGAAFDFVAGKIKRPPLFVQKSGFEWLFRLISEPRRLWKRYAYNNPLYIYRFFKSYRRNKKYTNVSNGFAVGGMPVPAMDSRQEGFN